MKKEHKIIIPGEKQLSNGIPKGKLDYMMGIISDEELYAESYARQMWGEYYDNEYDTGMGLTYGEACKKDFLAGVEYQKEQSKNLHSEEELLDFADFYHGYKGLIKREKWEILEMSKEEVIKKWFEQFKKK